MRKHLGKKLVGSVIAGAMAFSMLAAPIASAAGAATTGEGKVYAPVDIVDVIVPTKFKIAINPLMVDIKENKTNTEAFGLVGKTQILSGTYAIENRSTIPVNMKVDFTVTGGTKSKGDTAANVAAADANPDKATAPLFSLDMITTAAGTAQKPVAEPANKTAEDGTVIRPDDYTADATMENVKLAKASTEAKKITEDATGKAATKLTTNFMLNAGPYTANYVAATDKVEYTVPANAAYDTVAFTFTGTTTTKMDLWAAEAKGPSISAVYTLTKSTKAAYANTGFSPIWKAIPLTASDAKVTIKKPTTATGTITTTGTVEVDATAVAATADKTNVTITSLQPDAKKITKKLVDIGTIASAGDPAVHTLTVDGNLFTALELVAGTPIPNGYYNVTVGKTTFIVAIQ